MDVNPRRFILVCLFILGVISLSIATTAAPTSQSPPSSLICPEVEEGTNGTCVHECISDANCTEDLKCCPNGCGMVCVTGVLPSEEEEDKLPRLVWTEVFTTERKSRVNSLPADPAEYVANSTITTRFKFQLNNHNFLAIAGDYDDNIIFFSDGVSKQIFSGSLDDDEDGRSIYKGTSQTVEGIAVDWIANNIYWCDAGYDWIMVANYNGEYSQIVVDTGLDKPRDIVVFPHKGYMYWTDWGVNSTSISMATLSGDGVEALVSSSDMLYPNGLSIDFASETLYWVDANPSGSKVESVSLDGSNRRLVFTATAGQSHFFDVTPFQDYLFMTDWHGNLQCINQTSGEFRFSLRLRSRPHGITTYGKDLLPAYPKSPCLSNPCHHLCIHDAHDEYKCLCGRGYVQGDSRTCVEDEAALVQPSIILLSKTKLCYFPGNFADLVFPDDFEPPCILTDRPHAVALAVDVNANWAFFSDFQWKRIYRVRLVPSAAVEQISGGIGSVEGMAVDYINQNLYWTDNRLNHIVVSNYDGSRRMVLLDTDVLKPRSIVIHMETRTMFWTEFGPPYEIERADLDGQNRRVIVTLNYGPSGLAYDDVTGRLVFGETGTGTLYSFDIASNTLVSIHSRSRSIPFYDMEVFGDYLIWTEWGGSNGIHAINLETRNIHQSQLINEPVYGVRVFSGSKQRANLTSGDCVNENGGCSQLCVATADSHRCFCSTGYELGDDGRTCQTGVLVQDNFALVTDSYVKTIFQVDLTGESHNFSAISLDGLKNPIAVDFDPVERKVYFTDVIGKKISRADLNGSNVEELQVDNVFVPDGLALDYVSRLMYWSDAELNVISVSRMDGRFRRSLIKEELDQPRAIVLEPFEGYIFWSDWGQEPKIEKAFMDGTNRETIISTDIAWVNGLTIDRTGRRLYWCDARTDNIESSRFDGTDRLLVLDLGSSAHPFGIAIFNDYMYWTDWTQRGLMRANKTQDRNSSSYSLIGHSEFLRLNGIVVFSEDAKLEGATQCTTNNGGCSQLCLMTPNGRQCHCEDGSGLLEDGVSCQERDSLCPSTIPHGRFPYYCDRMPGAECSVECEEGHHPAHQNFTCLEGPRWNFPLDLICRAISCPALNMTENVQVGECLQPYTLNSICRFTCKLGFLYASGQKDRTCQEDGTWTGEDLVCERTICPALEQPSGGRYQPSSCTEGDMEYESQCRVFCGVGYDSSGPTLLTCLATGSWSVEPNSVTCIDISPPEFSDDCSPMNVTAPEGSEYYEYRGTDFGVTDNSGTVDVAYNLPPPVFLEEGVHSFVQTAVDEAGNEAVCAYTVSVKVNHCPLLSIPYNSDMREICDTHHGATCEFRCSMGFRLEGTALLTCTETGDGVFTWDNPAPHCEAVQCELPSLDEDSLLVLCAPPINAGSVCAILCNDGYKLVSGNIFLSCSVDGNLEGEIPICIQRRCPVLEAPQNGAINPIECTTTGVAAEETCTYSCADGFQLQGAETRVCDVRGRWPTMDAERECRDVNGPDFNGTCPSNMLLVASSGEETVIARWNTPTVFDEAGHVVNVSSSLESGSVLGEGIHSVIIHAFDNSGNRMSCFFVIEVKVIRCPIHPVPGNALSNNCSRLVNSNCTFSCNDGYRLLGSQMRTCTWDGSSDEGTWSGEEPNCEAITCPPFEVTEGLHVRGCNFDVEQIPYGSMCSLFCEEGYSQVIDAVQMKCSGNGTWEGEPLTCTPVLCDALALKQHSSVFPESCVNGSKPGEVCSYSCDSGYDLIGPANRTCSIYGSWDYDDQAPTCKDVTPPTFDCPTDALIISIEDPCTQSISEDIPHPPASDNDGISRVVTVTDEITTVGNYTVVFIARDNVGLTANCTIDVSITAITCPELNSRLVTSLSCGNMFGSVATFQCSQYDQLIGVPTAECQQNGMWSASIPTCQAVFCAPLEVVGSISISNPTGCPSENVVPGTTCEITCDLNGASPIQVVTCRANDTTWRMIDGSVYDPVYWSSHCTDLLPPVITCPTSLQFNLTGDSPTISATWDLPTAIDNYDTSPDISGPTVPVILGIGVHLQEYIATDMNGNTDQCIFTVEVLDMTPPMVTGCPSEVVVIQISNIQDIVTWEEPVFTDNVEIESIHSDLRPGYQAGSYGSKEVVYTARDSSSNVRKCEFQINVVPEATGCKALDPPSNGALTCNNIDICTLTCYEGYSLGRSHNHSPTLVLVCNNNMWNNMMNLMTPSCGKRRNSISRMDMAVFNSSTCAESKDAVKEKFREILMNSMFWHHCQFDDGLSCKFDNLQVECGEDTRRKRAADNTTPLLNITYVIHVTSNSSLDTFERALNLSVSAFFGPSNPVINLVNGISAEMIPERSMQGMPMVNCSTGEEPFQLTCLTCPPGTFFKMRTQTCVNCPKGFYQDESGQRSCKRCDDGLSTPSTGTSDPKYCKHKCQPGEYSYTGLAPCLLCPLNSYQPHIGSLGCIFCPEGTFTTREGSSYASSCRAPRPEVTTTRGVDTNTLSTTRGMTSTSTTTPTTTMTITNAVADITTSKPIPTKKSPDNKKGTEKPTKKPENKPEGKEDGKKGAQTGQPKKGSIWIWIIIGIAVMLGVIATFLLIAYITKKRQWAGHRRLYHSEEPFVGHEFENDHSMSESPHKPLQPEVSGNVVAFQNPAFAEVDL